MSAAESAARQRVEQSVSRETWQRLLVYKSMFDSWQKRINLVAPSTAGEFWSRHVADSLQLLDLAPHAAGWVDLGSGGGFPGLVVAAARTDEVAFRTDLVESNGKKAAFLRETARRASIRATIHAERLEDLLSGFAQAPDVISARALAPLDQLVAWCAELLKTGSLGLYLKGRDANHEIEALGSQHGFQLQRFPSRTDPQGSIVAIWNPERCPGPSRQLPA